MSGRPGVLEIVLRGAIAGPTIDRALRDARRLIAAAAPGAVVLDTAAVERYAPDVRGPGVQLFALLRGCGVDHVVLVASSGPIRMIGSAVAFAGRLPLEVCPTRDAALRALDARR